MKTSIPQPEKDKIFSFLQEANKKFQHIYPGDPDQRQPVHTVYGGAHLFKSETIQKLGNSALRTFQMYAPNATDRYEAELNEVRRENLKLKADLSRTQEERDLLKKAAAYCAKNPV